MIIANSNQERAPHSAAIPQELLSNGAENQSIKATGFPTTALPGGPRLSLREGYITPILLSISHGKTCLPLLLNPLAVVPKYSTENNQWTRFPNGKQNLCEDLT